MPITYFVTIVHADGSLTDRLIDAFCGQWAERIAARTIVPGDVVLTAVPFIGA